MTERVATMNTAETSAFVREFARETLLKRQHGPGATVIALTGELGAGKTTFAAAFAKAFGIRERIQSPTFVLVKEYALQRGNMQYEKWDMDEKLRRNVRSPYPILHISYSKLVHIDCYRLERPAELLRLGLRETLADPRAIVLIEWAERIRRVLPKDTVWIELRHGATKSERFVRILG